MDNQNQIEDNSVVQCVDALLHDAIAIYASDIHLEPMQDNLRVRYRLDGVLCDKNPIEKNQMSQVLSRLKVLARINIAEKRIPQDGKFSIVIAKRPIDFRVSTFPSLYGEKIVVRILDRASHAMSLDQLGFSDSMLTRFKKLIATQSGFFLVTGPTGSGKTTTLYAALSELHSPEKNIVTLEDPVEYNLKGITQGHINPDVGFTFEKGIRALLRQDPDVLMVGEVRDKQTARIAIEAALTGHLVLSTLHTNDAPSAIMRLMDMGIEPYLINASLSGVLAQRLVRKICQQCKDEVKITDQEKEVIARLNVQIDKLFRGNGCVSCSGLGFKGRIGIFELLELSHDLRSLIVHRPVFNDIYRKARQEGMLTLIDDAQSKINNGIISFDEVVRVVA